MTNKPTIPTVPTNVSSFTNDSGYITGYTVTESDVTDHEDSISITTSQVTGFDTDVSTNSAVALNTAKETNVQSDWNATSGASEILNKPSVVSNDTTGEPTGSDSVNKIVSLTQAEYDAGTPVADTFYLITDA